MVSLKEARAIIVTQILPLGSVQTPLEKAHGLILREDVVAAEDYPGFDRSLADGYAIKKGDMAERFAVVGEVLAGQVYGGEIEAGQCVRIFAGAQLPQGASQVIGQEQVIRQGDEVVIKERSEELNVRRKGEDARVGEVLLRAGTRLRASEAALLAQVGVSNPRVAPKPRVVHLVAGDELIPPSGKPGPGQVRDSNSTMVAGLLSESGARLVHQRRCKDEVNAIVREAKAVPVAGWDVLLISGGGCLGDYDFGAQALMNLGFQLHFQGINLQPGKPLVFGTRGRQVAFVLPGNPVSHFVVYHTVVRLALERLEGVESSFALAEVSLGGPLPANTGSRETYWPARVAVELGQFQVRPLGWQSSGDLCALASVNALVQMGAGAPELAVGQPARCVLLDAR